MTREKPNGLRREEILRRSSQFRKVLATGERRHGRHFIIYLARNKSHPRLGLTVSKKVGNAVVRNRVKRRIREYFRKNKRLIPQIDLVVVAKRGSGSLSSGDIDQELQRAITEKPLKDRT